MKKNNVYPTNYIVALDIHRMCTPKSQIYHRPGDHYQIEHFENGLQL
jgi:hypothetical protein